MTSLHDLRDLNLSAVTRFTADEIMRFVSSLGPGNQGFVLGVTMEDADFQVSDEEQSMIRDRIGLQVGGRFEFMYNRGEDPKLCSSMHAINENLQIRKSRNSTKIQIDTSTINQCIYFLEVMRKLRVVFIHAEHGQMTYVSR